ncbi:hypothetical protein DSECCO2_603310 [anaerobic digester metagenome]
MQLHGDAPFVIGPAEADKNSGLVFLGLLRRQRTVGHRLLEGGVGLRHREGTVHDVVQTVVTGAAAHLVEEIQTGGECIADRLRRIKTFFADASGQFADIFNEAGLGDIDGLIGSEGRTDLAFDAGVGFDLRVPLKRVDGVVGRANKGDARLLNQSSDGERGVVLQLFVA